MESMESVLKGMNPLKRKTPEGLPNTSDLARREIIKAQLMAFYLSCRRELPATAEMLEIEIDLAMRDWEEIPTAHLEDACTEARKQAGAFMPTNGLVAQVWREKDGDKKEAALKAIRAENTAKYLAAPGDDVPTEEQRAEIAAQMAALAESLK